MSARRPTAKKLAMLLHLVLPLLAVLSADDAEGRRRIDPPSGRPTRAERRQSRARVRRAA